MCIYIVRLHRCFLYRCLCTRNCFTKVFKNLTLVSLDTDLEVILLGHQNNYIGRSSVMSKAARYYDILATNFTVLHNYFVSTAKLFSGLHSAKFLDTSASRSFRVRIRSFVYFVTLKYKITRCQKHKKDKRILKKRTLTITHKILPSAIIQSSFISRRGSISQFDYTGDNSKDETKSPARKIRDYRIAGRHSERVITGTMTKESRKRKSKRKSNMRFSKFFEIKYLIRTRGLSL